ncbi:MAG: hypothetical protein K5785_03450 [Nitrosarchaeum sp.]|nr:hypothetical protein [Nitrosarchaeum sp.]
MKLSKIISICINFGLVCIGLIVIANILVSYEDVNPLTAYEFWGFGILPIIFGSLFLGKVLAKPKIQKKKK